MPRAWENIPPHIAIPIVAAFLLQISFYLLPALASVRRRLENRLSPPRLATFAVVASVAPYLVYSLPTGVFQVAALLNLLTLCLLLGFLFVLCPTRSRSLTWQDLLALSAVAVVMLGRLWRRWRLLLRRSCSPSPSPRPSSRPTRCAASAMRPRTKTRTYGGRPRAF